MKESGGHMHNKVRSGGNWEQKPKVHSGQTIAKKGASCHEEWNLNQPFA